MGSRRVKQALFLGIILAVLCPSLRGGEDPWRQLKDTLISMNQLTTALQSYQTDYDAYPVCDSLEQYAKALEPDYMAKFPFKDGWGHRFVIKTTKDHFTIISYGEDGVADTDQSLTWKDMNSDLIYKDGESIKCPERFSRSGHRRPDSLR